MAALVQSGSVALAGLAGLVLMPRVTAVRFMRVTWSEVQERGTGEVSTSFFRPRRLRFTPAATRSF